MSWKLVCTGESVKEIREQVMAAAGDFLNFGIVRRGDGTVAAGANPITPVEVVAQTAVSAHAHAEGDAAQEPKKRGRKPSSAQKVEAAVSHEILMGEPQVNIAKPAPVFNVPTKTKAELKAVASSLCESHGIDIYRTCITKFGCSKIDELKEGQYGAFFAECEQALKQPVPEIGV